VQLPAENLTDEELARRLQAEEDAAASGQRGPYPAGGQQPQLPDLINGFMGALFGGSPSTASQSRGRANSRGVPGNSPMGPDPQAAMQGLMQGVSQVAAGLQQMQPQPRRPSGSHQGVGSPQAQPPPHLHDILQNLGTQADQFNRQLLQMQQHWQQQIRAMGGQGQRGASASTLLENTALVTFEGAEATADGQCIVCLEQFQPGEELRILPCLHRYHRSCIDPWLQQNAKCPSCNHRFH